MTQEELKRLYLETEHGTFTPMYTYDEYDQETSRYTNLIIQKSSQEVYDEWLANKDNPLTPTPDKTEIWQEQMQAAMAELSMQVAKNTLLK